MSLKALFGMADTDLSDSEIVRQLKEALDSDKDSIEFQQADGTLMVVHLPHIDFAKYIDPWDGKR